jgi:putative ABC transport system permease protein
VLSLPGDRIVFSAPQSGDDGATFADSAVTAEQADRWAAEPGVTGVEAVGIAQSRAEAGGTRAAVALFGMGSGGPSESGTVTLSTGASSALSARTGDRITIGGREYTVSAVAGDDWYSHTPVIRMTLPDWRAYSASTGNPDAFATVLAVSGDPDWAAGDRANGTVSQTVLGSLTALSSFRSEIGSLLLMIALLFGISGLVVGAFFTVWTMQRTGDIAVLKALGASTPALVRDALGQALIVLAAGIGVGLAAVAGLGALAGGALPFLLSPLTTLVPGAILVVLGLAGAAFALRSVTSADPLTALGSNR